MTARREQRTLRIPPEIDQAIRRVAERTGEAQAVVMREILKEGLTSRGALDASTLVDALSPVARQIRA